MTPTKVITLWQPWASLMAYEKKRIETRHWGCDYRGPLAIHAAVGWNRETAEFCKASGVWNALGPWIVEQREQPSKLTMALEGQRSNWLRDNLPRGAIVGVCDLIACYPTCNIRPVPWRPLVFTEFPELDNPNERAFGNYDLGRFGLVTENMRRLATPVPYKSRQGKLLDLPADVEALVMEELRRAA